MKTTSATRCSVQLKGHNFCDAASVEDAPFPICERHMIQLIRFAMTGPISRAEVQNGDDVKRVRHQKARRDAKSVVYYIDMGNDLIKIGRSAQIANRLETLYRQPSDVLAVEIGGAKTEAHRHKQFASDRVEATENFRASKDLKRHVHQLATASNALTLAEAMRQQQGMGVTRPAAGSPLINWI